VNSKIHTMLKAICEPPPREADLKAIVEAAPPVEALPAPQATWMLMGLIRYRERKRWAFDILQSHVQYASPGYYDAAESTGTSYAEERREGIVGGLPEWEYFISEDTAWLRNRVSREYLHMSLVRDPVEDIGAGPFRQYLAQLRMPGPIERRLVELHPGPASLDTSPEYLRDGSVVAGVDASLEYLQDCRAIDGDPRSAFSLAPELDDFIEPLMLFCEAWEDPSNRVRLGAAIGDWLAVHEAAKALSDPELTAMTAERAKQCRRLWLDYLRGKVALEGLDEDRLSALANAEAEELPVLLEMNLSHGGYVYPAVEIIANDPSWCPRVFALLTEHPERSSNLPTDLLLDYLAHHQHRTRETIGVLANIDQPPYDVLIPRAVEHARDLLPALLRKALRSSRLQDRQVAAAVLAIIDNRWSRRELTTVLEESDDPDATQEYRAALRESRQHSAWRIADQWEAAHPEMEFLRPNPMQTTYEQHNKGPECVLGHRMFDLHDRVAKFRHDILAATDC